MSAPNRHGKVQAIYNGTVIAESGRTKKVEGNYYFPPDSIKDEYFSKSKMKTLCPWKGIASYYNIEVGKKSSQDAAWTYKIPFPLAFVIRKHIAFYGDIEIKKVDS